MSPKVKKAYIDRYTRHAKKIDLLKHVSSLQEEIYSNFFGTTIAIPSMTAHLSYENMELNIAANHILFDKLEKYDAMRTQALLYAEKKCRKLRMGGVLFSPEVNRAGAAINLYKLLIKRNIGRATSFRKITRLA